MNAHTETIEDFVEQLLFSELQPYAWRSWWQNMTIDKAYQILPRYEAEYLESLLTNQQEIDR
jgi:hypothetical protein